MSIWLFNRVARYRNSGIAASLRYPVMQAGISAFRLTR
jgi:hypothetical protein